MLKLDFYFLQIVLKIHNFAKSDKDKSFGEQPEPTSYLICFWLCCVIVEIFFTKTAKISHYSQLLHSLFAQCWDAIFYLSEVLVWQIK